MYTPQIRVHRTIYYDSIFINDIRIKFHVSISRFGYFNKYLRKMWFENALRII